MTSDAAPERLAGIDLARAVAIFGMITVNFRAALTDEEMPDWLRRAAEQVDGRAAALFVVLAGIGISLLTRRARLSGEKTKLVAGRWTILRRAMFLFLAGLAFRQVWEFDILHFYGVYLIAAAFLIDARDRWLALAAAALTLLFPLLYFVLPDRFGIPFWDTTQGLSPDQIAIDLFFQGYHPVAPWLAFLLVGMILGRANLADPRLRRRWLIAGIALVAVGEAVAKGLLDIGLLKLGFEIAPRAAVEAAADAFGTDPYPPMPLFVLVGLGWSLAIVSACLAIAARWGERSWLQPFLHAGQLALTIYLFHGTAGAWLPAALGFGEPLSLAWALAYSALFYAACILLATLWRRRFSRGPVEALMRRLSRPRRA
jgi:uncharacterized membrane protein YeiB